MNIPTHVSIIMDGNGRWAGQRGLPRLAGHAEGVESVRAITTCAAKAGVRYLSLYAFSEENWNRSEAEVGGLMEMMFKSLKEEISTFLDSGIRLRVIGHRDRLPAKVEEAIRETEALTAGCEGMTLILMLSYSGKWDILQAARHYAQDCLDALSWGKVPEELDERLFAGYLATAGIPDPDLLIRTSGELRISNYMLWQTAYTEFYFTDVLWPDFREKEFGLALEAFQSRDRRYGKIK